jgi:hypothetical protein
MRKIKRSTSTFEQPQPGTYTAVITTVADLGMQSRSVGGETSIKHQLGVTYELTAQTDSNGKALTVSETYVESLHEAAKLTPVVEAALGAVPDEFDPLELLGKVLSVTVDHRTDNHSRTWANVKSVGALPSAAKKGVKASSPLTSFDLDAPDAAVYGKLPPLFRHKIERRVRPESKATAAPDASDANLPW